jgi:hypothetical protein
LRVFSIETCWFYDFLVISGLYVSYVPTLVITVGEGRFSLPGQVYSTLVKCFSHMHMLNNKLIIHLHSEP